MFVLVQSVSDRLLILWQEYRNQQRSGLSLVQAASQLLASFLILYIIFLIILFIIYTFPIFN